MGHGRAESTMDQGSEAEAAGQKKGTHAATAAGAEQVRAEDGAAGMKNG
jgi:hypothetical protein